MSSAFDSGPANIQSCQVNGTFPAAAFNAGKLQLVFPDQSNNITIATDDISQFVQTRSGLNTWKVATLASSFPTHQKIAFTSASAPGVVACGAYNYIFWVDTNGPVAVVRCRPDGTQATVSTVELSPVAKEQSVQLELTKTTVASNPVAIVAPDGKGICLHVLIANPKAFTVDSGSGQINVPAGASLWISCYLKPEDFQPFGTWPGQYTGKMIDQNGAMAKNFASISAAWFTQGEGAFQHDAGDPILNTFYLVVAGYGGKNAVSYVWTVNTYGLPIIEDGGTWKQIVGGVTPVTGIGGAANSLSRGVQLARDPSGAVIAFFCLYDSPSDSNALMTFALFSPNSTNANNGISAPKWMSTKGLKLKYASMCRPSAVFVGLPLQHGKVPPFAAPQGTQPATGGKPPVLTGYMQTQILFMFSALVGSSASMPFQLQYETYFYGTTVTIPQAGNIPPRAEKLILGTVADTFPYPVPAPNIWDGTSPSGMVDWTVCRYDYLVGNQAESEAAYDFKQTVGAKAGNVVTRGIGVAAELAIGIGAQESFAMIESTANATVLSVVTKGTPVSATNLGIRPQGAYVGRSCPTLALDLSFFADRTNHLQHGSAIPLYWALRATGANSPTTTSGDYPAYCYTPGNLATYQPGSINAKMQLLFTQKFPNGTDLFTIGGKNYSDFYTGGDYVNQVVDRFGAKCFGADGDQSYLEFSFGSTESQKTEYQETSKFRSAGSMFLNTSTYVGIGWGEGIEFYGLGESFEAYVMAGLETSWMLTGTESKTASWGLSLADYLNPLAPEESYTVRMYFLKPSRLWSIELEQFGFGAAAPQNIDFAHSAPMRFLFTVTEISPALMTRLSSAPFVMTAPPPTSS